MHQFEKVIGMVSDSILEKMRELREAREMTLVRLPSPSAELDAFIASNGGRFLRRGYDEWCHDNATCAHNSHDPGQEWSEYEVPKAWIEEKPSGSVFEYDEDRDSGQFIVPTGPPLAVVIRDHGQAFAKGAFVAPLRPQAMEAWLQMTGEAES